MRDRFIKVVDLLKMVLLGKVSEEELDKLDGEMQATDLRQILNNCRNQEFLSQKLEAYRRYSPVSAYRQFLRQVRPNTFKMRMFRIAVAAAVLLIVGVGGWWLSRPRPMPPAVMEDTIIEPGTKKARLKLADGKIIDVTGDSIRIEKTEEGKITYAKGEISYKAEKKAKKLVFNELIVPVAGESFIMLTDSTRVWVNSASRLKYPVQFVGDERIVFLEGEAYFEVKKDTKPFIVKTSGGNVNVLGTVFDVKAYREDGAVYTTLVSGKVNFQGKQTVVLEPGEQAVAFTDGKMEKRKVDLSEFIGWKEGVYVFKKQTLENIMTDLSRWYGVNVFYQSPEVKGIAFTGNLKRYDSINTFMEILQRTGEVRYKINGNTIVLYK